MSDSRVVTHYCANGCSYRAHYDCMSNWKKCLICRKENLRIVRQTAREKALEILVAVMSLFVYYIMYNLV